MESLQTRIWGGLKIEVRRRAIAVLVEMLLANLAKQDVKSDKPS